MPARHDILDEREALARPLAGSILFHAALAGAAVLATWLSERGRVQMGDPNSFGGTGVLVTPVSSIPLPNRGGVKNQVANDTESNVPARTKPEPKRAVQEDPEAIAIKGRERKKQEREQAQQRRYTNVEEKPNQLYSSTGQAASSPLFGGMAGSGGVGVGRGSPFGNRFGAYATLIRDRVAQKWRTGEIDPRIQSATPAIVLFDVMRDGSVRDVRLLQRSGISAIDYSAQRAVMEAGPFPPLPREYERDSATVELWFQLKR
ncbi:MAG: TonB family protein [Bryobacteraceae bacterium]|nr:TonB family protein [Bryobacteraceae bacterium]